MSKSSLLLLPRRSLAGCIFAAIVRDTRGRALSDAERFNHFPASPLVAATYVIEGETRLVPADGGLAEVKLTPPLAPVTTAGSYNTPLTSWNPGAVFALVIVWRGPPAHRPRVSKSTARGRCRAVKPKGLPR